MKTSKATTPINNSERPIVKIATPCHESWSDMTTTEKGKFCGMCTKEVVDFTSSTNSEIAAHLNKSEGSVCGRLYSSQVITNPRISKVQYFIKKAKTYLAAFIAVVSVSALFGERADAQCRLPVKGKMKMDPIPEKSVASTRETTIRGTVTLGNSEQPAPKAIVQVSSGGEIIQQTETNTAGEYKVQLPVGSVQ
ncbi:MAG: hypothetical protein JKX74_02610, partial [Flavobacteriales bacterium]|nr:hypothetical protein [Flavobacteriales bacterium]